MIKIAHLCFHECMKRIVTMNTLLDYNAPEHKSGTDNGTRVSLTE